MSTVWTKSAQLCILLVITFILAPHAGAVLFEEDFDAGTAASKFGTPFFSSEVPGFGGACNTPGVECDGAIEFAFDYSSIGLLPAPNSTGETTIGLGLQVNIFDDGAFDEGEAIAVSPIIAALPSEYRITADTFIFYGGGAGASEHAVIGINSDQNSVPFTFEPAGVGTVYHVPHDSGLDDYELPDDYYRVSDGTLTGLYGGAPSLGLEDPEVLNIPFVGDDPIFDDPGYAGNRWFSMELLVRGGTATFSIEGVVIDQFDVSTQAAGDLLFGVADIFNSVNSSNWVVWDNIVVSETFPPEGLDGDYNGDNTVDIADYVLWRNNLGAPAGTLLNDPVGGVVGTAHYDTWRTNFGSTLPASIAADSVAVPESASSVLLVLGLGVTCVALRRVA